MQYKNYIIEDNENYYPAHPESKLKFTCTDDCDTPMGFGSSIEDCIEQIDERLDY